jgi:hypothetical protein
MANGELAFRFEPSAFNADPPPTTALGDDGEFIEPWHATATTAQSASTTHFN